MMPQRPVTWSGTLLGHRPAGDHGTVPTALLNLKKDTSTYPCVNRDIHGYPYVVDIPGYPYISLDIPGYPKIKILYWDIP